MNEDRFALDGQWDIGVGVWFEAVYLRRGGEVGPLRHEKLLNLGADYTLDIGDGLTLTAEHLIRDLSEELWGSDQGFGVSALYLNYPLGLSDTLGAFVYYDWNNDEYYTQIGEVVFRP